MHGHELTDVFLHKVAGLFGFVLLAAVGMNADGADLWQRPNQRVLCKLPGTNIGVTDAFVCCSWRWGFC